MIGNTISHYKILEKLGEGGMGVVYKAEDTKLERTVALKFLAQQNLGGEEERARFIREAKAAAALTHPNICTVYEINDTGGQAFIAMEYIEGYTLQETVEMGPLNADDALDIAIQVAAGLREAHEKGIVHRDIKLSNIMITARGQAKITDFGLAKLLGHTSITETGTIMGTVDYMSPEQANGDPVDHRTDIWSLGVVLYEMLTGRRPFDAESKVAVIHKIIYEEPDRILDITDNLPYSVEEVVEKMMEKVPRDRYENMGALITDLQAVRSAASIHAKKESPSIAVLPFADMSADKGQEYFCDGLAEELINALTHVKDLKVIARTSAFSFKGKNVNVRDIGKELRVGNVLQGSVRKAGNRLRITAQLVDTAEGHHLWSERYDREMEDVFAIQDEITSAIVENLQAKLLEDREATMAKRQRVGPEVYDLYLRGRYFLYKTTLEDVEKAIGYFEKAIEKDSSYALAYVGLADSYYFLQALNPQLPQEEIHPKAKEAALKAVAIDDTLAEAHASLGLWKTYAWEWEAAEKEFRRAIELNPGSAMVRYLYSTNLMLRGRFEEAVREIEQARVLDPLSFFMAHQVVQILTQGRQYDRAIAVSEKTLECTPDLPYIHELMGMAYLSKEMHDEALAALKKEREIQAVWHAEIEAYIGVTYARMGKKAETRKVLDDMLERSKREHVSPTAVAYLYFHLGEHDQGFEWLDKAHEKKDFWLSYLKIEPVYDIVRSDQRFIALLKKIGLDK